MADAAEEGKKPEADQPGKFAAVGFAGLRIGSGDGMTWSEPAKPTRGHVYLGVCHGAGRFVAVGKYGYSAAIVSTSTDGRLWDEPVMLKDQRAMEFVAFGGGRFVAVGGDVNYADTHVMVSTDGKTWEKPLIVKGNSLRRMAYGGEWFVAVGSRGRRARSKDGLVWEDAPGVKAVDTLIDVAYGNGVYVGVGLHGLRMTSDDGLKWSEPVRGEEGEHYNSIVWTGTQFTAVGFGATLTSPDGRRWERRVNENAPLSAVFGGGQYVGCRWKGRLLTSPDGVVWTERLKSDHPIEAVASS